MTTTPYLADSSLPAAVTVIIWPIIMGLALLAGWLIHRHRHKKLVAYYTQWANHYGFRFSERDDTLAALSGRTPFNLGRQRGGHYVFRGLHKGRHIIFGQYQYTIKSGKHSKTCYVQVVAVATPAPRPFLDITKETAGSKFLAMFGKRDLQLESQQFNDTFKIDTDNERFAYDVLSPQNMEWLLADMRANMYQWRFEGQWLMTAREGRLNVTEVFYYADFLHDLIDIVPAHVWKN